MEKVQVRIKRFFPDAIIPKYMTELASGADCYAYIDPVLFADRLMENDLGRYIPIAPHERLLIPLGFATDFQPGYEVQVRARSGLSHKNGIGLVNGVGSIDSDYRGQFMASIINFDNSVQFIQHGDRICQIVMAPIVRMNLVETDDLCETERASGGFGHTGVTHTPLT